MDPKLQAISAYQQQFGSDPQFVARAPGRVNLLGEHVDYNEGFVLPAAIDRATYLAFSPSDDDANHILAADFGEMSVYTNASLANKQDKEGNPIVEWVLYPASVNFILQQAGHTPTPIKGAFSSNIPRGSGLSSSASVLVAFLNAYQAVSVFSLDKMEIAKLGQRAENQYVGVNCGIMDQFASSCGVDDHLLSLDCRDLQWQPVPLSSELAIVVADTSVRRKLTSGEYNKRRDACERAVNTLQKNLPGIHSLRDVTPAQFEANKHLLDTEAQMRAEHVVYEIDRTQKANLLLNQGDFAGFGKIMEACHASLRDLYEVSCPELDAMVSLAAGLPGYIGARLTGAGFGGCTVNLVRKAQAAEFAEQLAQRYAKHTNLTPEIYICKASAGASVERYK